MVKEKIESIEALKK